MVKNILFTLLFIVAMVACSDDDEFQQETFLEKYDGVYWHWKHEKHRGRQGGIQFHNDSTRIYDLFMMKYSPPNCWYKHAFDINDTYDVEYLILENSENRFIIQHIKALDAVDLGIVTYEVIGKNNDTLRFGGPGHYTYYQRNIVNPDTLVYCD